MNHDNYIMIRTWDNELSSIHQYDEYFYTIQYESM